jgi:uncharacterized protein YndB with AHSA1/START domain
MDDTIDTTTRTFRFVRELPGTPEDAFDAWTRPEDLTAWWDPDGTPLARCEVDLRPGGSFLFATAHHAPPFSGVYRHVERPSRLEFDAMGAHGVIRFDAAGARTRMVVTITSPNAEHFEMFVKLGVNQGTTRTLDNLVAHLGRPRR